MYFLKEDKLMLKNMYLLHTYLILVDFTELQLVMNFPSVFSNAQLGNVGSFLATAPTASIKAGEALTVNATT